MIAVMSDVLGNGGRDDLLRELLPEVTSRSNRNVGNSVGKINLKK